MKRLIFGEYQNPIGCEAAEHKQERKKMLKHYMTKYTTPSGKKYAESWLQLNAFGKCFCFWKRKIEI